MSAKRESLRVITYNIWHGLNPTSMLKFGEFETPAERERRLQLFLAQAREADADILFLQEVNPAPALTERIARELDMDAAWVFDNTGIKIAGFGLPTNLYSGLAILAKRDLGLADLGVRQLSGSLWYASRVACFQTSEVRTAGAATVRVNGREVLLVVTHLHHGPEITTEIREAIEGLARKSKIPATRPAEIFATMAGSDERRRDELKAATTWMSELGFARGPVIFAGDFNASPDSEELAWLRREHRFTSVTRDDDPQTLLMTWDYANNPNTHTLKTFKPVYEFEAAVNDVLQPILEQEIRRLDYIFLRDAPDWAEARHAELFGTRFEDGRPASDHFGIVADIVLRGTP